ncbi:MAG: hypothetical protein ACFFAN_10655 [Promethearchaeota archaeon]
MEIYEDLIEKDEEILWKKKFPPKNIIPKRKEFIRERNFALIMLLLLTVLSFIFIIIFSLLVLIVVILLSPLLLWVIFGVFKRDWEGELSIFQEYLKYYKEEDLRNHPKYYIITNKKILSNDRYHMDLRTYITVIDNVVEIKKDFLVINLNYLSEVFIESSQKFNIVYFKLNSKLKNKLKGKTKEAMAFTNLSKQESSEILKILFNLVPNLIIET